uniref:Uncharacterized protein n=1 Tax=Triticum urartu TaxID=4572 RepID=A0A8R7UMA1_TRIUA
DLYCNRDIQKAPNLIIQQATAITKDTLVAPHLARAEERVATCSSARCNLLTEAIDQDGQEGVLPDEHRRRRRASAGSLIPGRPSRGTIRCWRSISVAGPGRPSYVAGFLCAGRSRGSERPPRSPHGPDPVHLHRPNIYQARHGSAAACREQTTEPSYKRDRE